MWRSIGAAWAINERYNGIIPSETATYKTQGLKERMLNWVSLKELQCSAIRIRLFFTDCIWEAFGKGVSKITEIDHHKTAQERTEATQWLPKNYLEELQRRTWQLPILLP